ncbi:hypothetical protein D3C72_1335480 [compost metagenome]
MGQQHYLRPVRIQARLQVGQHGCQVGARRSIVLQHQRKGGAVVEHLAVYTEVAQPAPDLAPAHWPVARGGGRGIVLAGHFLLRQHAAIHGPEHLERDAKARQLAGNALPAFPRGVEIDDVGADHAASTSVSSLARIAAGN